MSSLYKDYNKSSKDLLTKGFNVGGEWRIEDNSKASKGTYAISTNCNSRGDVKVDIESLSASGAYYGMLSVTPKDYSAIKATIRAENIQNHRVEAIVSHKGKSPDAVSVEVSHQTVTPLAGGRLSINDKVTQKTVELALSMTAVDDLQVGCGTKFDLKSKTMDWSVACRLAGKNGLVLTAQTNQLRSFTADVFANAPLHPRFRPWVTAAVTVNPQFKTWDGSLALEWGCQLIQGNRAKVRIHKNLDWAVAYIASLHGGWTLSLSLDKSMKTGLTLTHS
ncbi:hypothetical protein JKF63_07585 [Porcisia hertigi]|uniref:Voltage-dependent anion-selective channel n=1 Tax=Porcisia hertigi TaxID=2761500 RepID=A0A836LM82_9TRYP|nr:hypothetical protein JKF63_07585 [Porcisia hertigi]